MAKGKRLHLSELSFCVHGNVLFRPDNIFFAYEDNSTLAHVYWLNRGTDSSSLCCALFGTFASDLTVCVFLLWNHENPSLPGTQSKLISNIPGFWAPSLAAASNRPDRLCRSEARVLKIMRRGCFRVSLHPASPLETTCQPCFATEISPDVQNNKRTPGVHVI